MDLLDRLLGHDLWTTTRLLDFTSELSAVQLDQQFDLGHGSIRSTFEHVIRNIEVWTGLMNGIEIQRSLNSDASIAALRARYETAALDFGKTARKLRDAQKLGETYLDILDQPPRAKSFGGTILHVLTHNHAHRTEILHMLGKLGVKNLIEGDLLAWEALIEKGEL